MLSDVALVIQSRGPFIEKNNMNSTRTFCNYVFV
jgi:hypothetical protein